MKKNKKNNTKVRSTTGFTIVELLVGMSVFIVFFVGAIGIFFGATKNQRILVERISMNNNAGLVLEQMARELRTGYFGEGQQAPASDCSGSITFTSGQEVDVSGNPVVITYAWMGDAITRTSSGGGSGSLTASNVEVKKLCIYALYAGDSEKPTCYPPRFVISMEIKSKNLNLENAAQAPSSFISTTVSSRILPREIQNASGADPHRCKEI